MSFKNCWTTSSSYDFQLQQQHSQRRWYCSQTALQWFHVLPGLTSELPGLSLVLPSLSLVLPSLSLVLPSVSLVHPCWSLVLPDSSSVLAAALRLVAGTPRLAACTLRIVTAAPRCSPCHDWMSYVHVHCSLVLPGAPEGHYIGPVYSGIWPPRDSGWITPSDPHWQEYILLMKLPNFIACPQVHSEA